MNLSHIWTLVSSQGFSTMCPSGLECSTGISVSSNTHPATCCCFIYIFKRKSSFSKHPNSRNAAGTRTRLHLFYAGPHMFVSQPHCRYWQCRVQSCSWQHLEKGLLRWLASGRVVPGRWHGIIMSRVFLLCFDKGGSSFLCCHSVLLAGAKE